MKRNTDPAVIEWKDNGTPYSCHFGDVYYSTSGGREESEYVFLEQNQIPEIWRKESDFTIGELGFGTGLNFLLTLQRWHVSHPPSAWLNYFTFEKFLVPVKDFRRANQKWSDLKSYVEEIVRAYPPSLEGLYCLELAEFNTRLVIGIGEALTRLKEVEGKFDAWYFDGFSPQKNPDLWSSDIFNEVARLSRAGTTFSSFSAAGAVRRNLDCSGFRVEKIKGYGNKRESIKGVFCGTSQILKSKRPINIKSGKKNLSQVVIIGAGLAGCSAAYYLSKSGFDITVLEKCSNPAAGASGHLAATYRPYLSASFDLRSRFYTRAFHFTSAQLRSLVRFSSQPLHNECGLLEIPIRERSKKIMTYLKENNLPLELVKKVSPSEATELSGLSIQSEGLYYPKAGYLFPKNLCDFYLSAQNISSRLYNTPAFSVQRENDLWKIKAKNGNTVAESPIVILANSFNCADFELSRFLRTEAVRGQVSIFSATAYSKSLRTVLSYGGYTTPCFEEKHLVGASYEHGNLSAETQEGVNDKLLQKLALASPLLAAEFKTRPPLSQMVAFRGSSFDRVPYIGPVPDPLSREPLDGLYITAGHGSRGMISCPFGAQILLSQISNSPAPIEKELLDAVAPARYLSSLKRG
jgi:tRNA 5-methylaminomethyl-2-thiouridine biosynthesis bifunctional protein